MENPHAERQSILLERILKNSVNDLPYGSQLLKLTSCKPVKVHRDDYGTEPLRRGTSHVLGSRYVAYAEQEILRANAYVKTAADLSTKYRKNVQYQLDATKSQVTELESETTASKT